MPMVSPNELLESAKTQMLEGRDPESKDDWSAVMNFMAFNISAEVAESACLLVRSLYDIPLTDDEVKDIVRFQNHVRSRKAPSIEKFLEENFGRTTALNSRTCVAPPVGCGGPANEFRDARSEKEYGISGFCQNCQDKVFGVEED
jgi:hypothetical protein